jgi:hypothetical protein
MDSTLAQILSELYRLTQENQTLKRMIGAREQAETNENGEASAPGETPQIRRMPKRPATTP